MSTPSQDVLTFSERPDLARELLTAGRELAGALGGGLTALAAGPGAPEAADDLLGHGADRVLVAAGGGEALPADFCLAALERAVAEVRPQVILIGAGSRGTEVAARLAQKLRVGCAGDCLSLAIAGGGPPEPAAERGALIVERRCYGRFVARQVVRSRPAIATVPARRFETPERLERPTGVRQELAVSPPPARARVVEVSERQKSRVAIEKAEVVVTAGRGVRNRDDLRLVEELAAELDGVVGATRPLTDDLCWLPTDVRVGLSGQTVRPRLYVACGVSGQIEHVVGMRESAVVVAINSDPQAPILAEADYCVVGDLYEVVPALTAALRELRRTL